MGNKFPDIFKSLKSWDIKPPGYLFQKIWSALTKHPQQDLSFAFAHFETFEPNSNENSYRDTELEAFRSLQNHSITPPPFSSLKLNGLIVEKKVASTTKRGTIVKLKYFASAAAAALIITVGLLFIYNKKTQDKTTSATQFVSTSPKNLSPANNFPVTNSSKGTIAMGQKSVLTAAINNNNHTRAEHSKKIKAYQHLTTEEGGLVDNDILLTLVNYNYSEYLPLLTEIKKNNRIKLSEYSYVNISDKMNIILQKMYATKGNKPARKAKKLRATMEKWKKRDEKHFDSNAYSNNPIDIIDLSEFILN